MFIEDVGRLDKKSVLDRELFDELFAITDGFEFESKLQEIQDHAKQIGVLTKFKSLLKTYKKEKMSVRDSEANISDFNNGVELNTGMWMANMDGICTWSDRGMVFACNHPIYPTKLLRNAETGKCKVELEFWNRGAWRKTIVDRKTICSTNSIIALADNGINANSDNARALVRYLSDVESLNEDFITEQKSSGKLGWLDGTFLPYDDTVVFDNEDNLRTLVDSIQEVGNRKKWMDTVRQLRSEGRIEVLIYLAASFGSVLVEPCGALPFIVDLWGDTGRGKTVALMLATSIWGDPNEGGYATDAKATVTAMEIRLNALNSLPMMIDDMAQIKNQEDDFSGLVYKWCAGRGRDRSNLTLGLNKQTSWQNCILTNAERSLVTETMQAGAVNRIIDVEMGDTPIFGENGSEIANILRHNYGFAGREFVATLQLIGDKAIRDIQKSYLDKLKDFAKKHEAKEEKQLIPMSILLAADQLSEEYIFKDGIRLDFEKCFNLLKNLGEVSEHKRAYNYLMDMIASNYSLHFEYDVERPQALWGVIEDGYAVIIGSVFNKLMKDAGFQDKAFLAWAAKQKLLKTNGDGRYKKKKRIGSSEVPPWCIFLKVESDDDEIVDLENVENPFE